MNQERQKEYDELGLPWIAVGLDIHYTNDDGSTEELFIGETDSMEVSKFVEIACGSYHAQQEEIDSLRQGHDDYRRALETRIIAGNRMNIDLVGCEKEIERLRGALDKIARRTDVLFYGNHGACDRMKQIAEEALG